LIKNKNILPVTKTSSRSPIVQKALSMSAPVFLPRLFLERSMTSNHEFA